MEKQNYSERYCCDFHMHSDVSDGSCSREDIILRALEENPGKEKMVLSISDHNAIFENLEELQQKYKEQITLVAGCEVSANYIVPETGKNLEVHILALDYDVNNREFREMLLQNQHDKRHYIEMILEKLEKVGIHVVDDYQELVDFVAPVQHVGRMSLARFMVQKGLCKTIDECFDNYFGTYGKRTCYVEFPHTYVSIETVIENINKAGGIAILCHPFHYKLDNEQLLVLIRQFKSLGGRAMECWYGTYTEEQRESLKKICKTEGLLPSAGSDFHGNPGEHLHHHFPGWIYDDLMSLKNEYCEE